MVRAVLTYDGGSELTVRRSLATTVARLNHSFIDWSRRLAQQRAPTRHVDFRPLIRQLAGAVALGAFIFPDRHILTGGGRGRPGFAGWRRRSHGNERRWSALVNKATSLGSVIRTYTAGAWRQWRYYCRILQSPPPLLLLPLLLQGIACHRQGARLQQSMRLQARRIAFRTRRNIVVVVVVAAVVTPVMLLLQYRLTVHWWINTLRTSPLSLLSCTRDLRVPERIKFRSRIPTLRRAYAVKRHERRRLAGDNFRRCPPSATSLKLMEMVLLKSIFIGNRAFRVAVTCLNSSLIADVTAIPSFPVFKRPRRPIC